MLLKVRLEFSCSSGSTHPPGSKADKGLSTKEINDCVSVTVAHLQIYIEKVTAETLDRVIERYDVYPLAVLDIGASVEVTHVTKLHTDIISCN